MDFSIFNVAAKTVGRIEDEFLIFDFFDPENPGRKTATLSARLDSVQKQVSDMRYHLPPSLWEKNKEFLGTGTGPMMKFTYTIGTWSHLEITGNQKENVRLATPDNSFVLNFFATNLCEPQASDPFTWSFTFSITNQDDDTRFIIISSIAPDTE